MQREREVKLPNDAVCAATNWVDRRDILGRDLEKVTQKVVLNVPRRLFSFSHLILHLSVFLYGIRNKNKKRPKL